MGPPLTVELHVRCPVPEVAMQHVQQLLVEEVPKHVRLVDDIGTALIGTLLHLLQVGVVVIILVVIIDIPTMTGVFSRSSGTSSSRTQRGCCVDGSGRGFPMGITQGPTHGLALLRAWLQVRAIYKMEEMIRPRIRFLQ